jgi:hypothetical protein
MLQLGGEAVLPFFLVFYPAESRFAARGNLSRNIE